MKRTIETCTSIALSAIKPDVAQRFAIDPEQTLREDLGLTVEAVDHLDSSRSDGGACDGVSYLGDGVILFRRTGNRRENFTLAHELGHWLVDQTDDVYDALAPYDDAAKMLESVCDRVAQALLLSADRVSSVLGTAPIEASHIEALYKATSASVPVCAIALARRLPGLGAVVIIDAAKQMVRYASVKPDDEQGWPTVCPWPGQTVPAGHPLRNLKVDGTLRKRTFWENQRGSREEFYVDATADMKRTIAVFSATDLWQAERFHPTISREFDQRPELEIRCCGRIRRVRGWPCINCGEPFCPECGKCRCDRRSAAETLCVGGCGMRYLPHLLVNGLCEDCR